MSGCFVCTSFELSDGTQRAWRDDANDEDDEDAPDVIAPWPNTSAYDTITEVWNTFRAIVRQNVHSAMATPRGLLHDTFTCRCTSLTWAYMLDELSAAEVEVSRRSRNRRPWLGTVRGRSVRRAGDAKPAYHIELSSLTQFFALSRVLGSGWNTNTPRIARKLTGKRKAAQKETKMPVICPIPENAPAPHRKKDDKFPGVTFTWNPFFSRLEVGLWWVRRDPEEIDALDGFDI